MHATVANCAAVSQGAKARFTAGKKFVLAGAALRRCVRRCLYLGLSPTILAKTSSRRLLNYCPNSNKPSIRHFHDRSPIHNPLHSLHLLWIFPYDIEDKGSEKILGNHSLVLVLSSTYVSPLPLVIVPARSCKLYQLSDRLITSR
jgi:hypothetical protein